MIITIRICCFVLLTMSVVPSAFAQTPAREQLKRFLTAVNSGDRPTLEQYAKASFSPNYRDSPSVDDALIMHKFTGGLDVLELTDLAPNVVKGWVRTRDSDGVMELAVEVEKEKPHRLEYFKVSWGTTPAKYFPRRLSEAAAIEAARAEAARRTAAGKFSGALLVARGNTILLREAFGLADRHKNIPNAIDTRFRTASTSKMFTAVAILRLVQDGKLKLDDPIGKIVPALGDKPVARATIQQLLTHTAGTGDIYGPRLDEHQDELLVHDDFIKLFGGDALLFDPGTKYEYSNLGYIFLGAAIEHASGRSYYDYIHESVFAPAGMTHSDIPPKDVAMDGRASGYYRPPGTREWLPASKFLDYRGDGAGGAWSTVDDLARFLSALRANRLLDEKYTKLMLTPREQVWPGRQFCAGVFLESYPGAAVRVGHSGAESGSNSEAWFMPDSGYVVIVMSNLDQDTATQVAGFIEARLPVH